MLNYLYSRYEKLESLSYVLYRQMSAMCSEIRKLEQNIHYEQDDVKRNQYTQRKSATLLELGKLNYTYHKTQKKLHRYEFIIGLIKFLKHPVIYCRKISNKKEKE